MSTNTMAKRTSDVRYTLAPSMRGPETVYDEAALKNMQFSLRRF